MNDPTDNELKAMEAGLKKAKEIHGAHPMMTDMERLIATIRSQAEEIDRLQNVVDDLGFAV